MDIKAIVTGWHNFLEKSEVTECLALKRAQICSTCPEAKKGMLLSVIKDDIKEVEGYYCNLCKCPLSALIRQSTKKCEAGRWT
jgi:hypothetical protein